MRLAFADPPYPGNAHLYADHPDYAGEVDHTALIARLVTYDGWALSTSAAALRDVLPLCPDDARTVSTGGDYDPGSRETLISEAHVKASPGLSCVEPGVTTKAPGSPSKAPSEEQR